jgi:hypothetical protein
MEDSTPQISDHGVENGSDRVTGWLNELVLEGHAQDKVEPVTPLRRQYIQHQLYDEVSPTETTFSGMSIIDKPHRNEALNSPSRQVRFYNDLSDTAGEGEEKGSSRPIRQPNFTLITVKSASLNSCDPDSSFGQQTIKATHATPSYGSTRPVSATFYDTDPIVKEDIRPIEPRFTIILSCLQCTLHSLPCSRTLPTCKRCTRGSSPSTCIMLRRRYDEELSVTSGFNVQTHAILKLRDEDPDVWKSKMRTRDKLKKEWQEKKDRENWVLPRIDVEIRGRYRKYEERVLESWDIGEGTGVWRGQYLCLAPESVAV